MTVEEKIKKTVERVHYNPNDGDNEDAIRELLKFVEDSKA